MPRNGSGVYSLPQAPFVPNTSISSSAVNDDLSDIGDALTGSVPTDGSKGMDGGAQFLLADSAAAAPALAFSTEPGLGLRRSAAHTAAFSAQGADIFAVSPTALTLAAGAQVLAGMVPFGPFVGEIRIFAGATAPPAWMFCSGYSLLRASYPALFLVLGTTFGSVDGTHFSIPNFNGRAPVGVDYGSGILTGLALGSAVGEATHLLLTSEIPAITPTGSVSRPTITTTVNDNQFAALPGGTGGANSYKPGSNSVGISATSALNSDPVFTGTPFGGGGVHNNVQPTLGINFMIFTGVV